MRIHHCLELVKQNDGHIMTDHIRYVVMRLLIGVCHIIIRMT